MSPDGARYATYGVFAVAIGLAVAVRWRGLRRGRRLRLERLWIVPALYAGFAAALFWFRPPHGREWLWVAAALVAGGGFGWLRGSTMRIAVDPDTHELNQRQSPAALVLLVALIAARTAARVELGLDVEHAGAGVIDAFVAFAVGLLALQRVEMFVRARRLLARARAA